MDLSKNQSQVYTKSTIACRRKEKKYIKVGSKNSFFLTFRQIADGGFEKIIEPINDFFKIEEKLQKVFQYCI